MAAALKRNTAPTAGRATPAIDGIARRAVNAHLESSSRKVSDRGRSRWCACEGGAHVKVAGYHLRVARSNLTPLQRRRLAQVSIDAAYDFLRDAAEECPELQPHIDVILPELDRATTTLGVRDDVERIVTRSPFTPKS